MSTTPTYVYYFLQRHFRHVSNVVGADELDRAKGVGARLRAFCEKNGIPVPEMLARSPQQRAEMSADAVLEGLGFEFPDEQKLVHPGLGAATDGLAALNDVEIAALKAYVARHGCTIEEAFMQLPSVKTKVQARGMEGLGTLFALHANFPDVVSFLIESHGGKVEPICCEAEGIDPADVEQMFTEGDIALLRYPLTDDGQIDRDAEKVTYLGDLSE